LCVADALLNDAAAPDAIVPHSEQVPVPDLPEETLLFLHSPNTLTSFRVWTDEVRAG